MFTFFRQSGLFTNSKKKLTIQRISSLSISIEAKALIKGGEDIIIQEDIIGG